MIDKIAVDPEIEVTSNVLAEKLNEVIESLNVRPGGRPVLSQPGPAQHVNYFEMMAQRLQTGPYATLLATDPSNALVLAIGEALTAFQVVVKTYKESLADIGKTKATLEV